MAIVAETLGYHFSDGSINNFTVANLTTEMTKTKQLDVYKLSNMSILSHDEATKLASVIIVNSFTVNEGRISHNKEVQKNCTDKPVCGFHDQMVAYFQEVADALKGDGKKTLKYEDVQGLYTLFDNMSQTFDTCKDFLALAIGPNSVAIADIKNVSRSISERTWNFFDGNSDGHIDMNETAHIMVTAQELFNASMRTSVPVSKEYPNKKRWFECWLMGVDLMHTKDGNPALDMRSYDDCVILYDRIGPKREKYLGLFKTLSSVLKEHAIGDFLREPLTRMRKKIMTPGQQDIMWDDVRHMNAFIEKTMEKYSTMSEAWPILLGMDDEAMYGDELEEIGMTESMFDFADADHSGGLTSYEFGSYFIACSTAVGCTLDTNVPMAEKHDYLFIRQAGNACWVSLGPSWQDIMGEFAPRKCKESLEEIRHVSTLLPASKID